MTSRVAVAISRRAVNSADELDAEAFELEARAASLHAEAARLRARLLTSAGVEWIDALKASPRPRKVTSAACRSGELRAVKSGRQWLTTRADIDAWIARSTSPAANENASASTDDDVRELLGLARRLA